MRFAPRLAVPISVLVFALCRLRRCLPSPSRRSRATPHSSTCPGVVRASRPDDPPRRRPPTPTRPDAEDSEATPAPDTSGTTPETQQQTTPEGRTEGGTEAPSTDDSATTDQAPPAGSDAEQFEDFCAENPGAC